MDRNKETKNFSDTNEVIRWNRRLLSIIGVWPLKVRDSIFLPCFVYGCIGSLLGLIDFIELLEISSDFETTLMNLVENILMFMTVVKFTIIRIKKKTIMQFLVETDADYNTDNYKNDKEKLIFLKYNKLSYKFITIACVTMTLVNVTYFFKAVIPSVIMVMRNSSSTYQQPFKIKPFVKITDGKTYAIECICEFISVPIVISGYVGTDCLLVCFGLHLTAQLMILKYRVHDALKEDSGSRNIRSLVRQHHRLIRLADLLENGFTYVILQQFMGTIVSLCVSGYHTLLSLSDSQAIKLIVFAFHICDVSSTLFVYCYIGECLIEESTSLCEALYLSDWYDMLPMDQKCIQIFMMRARKPLQLTSAKFCAVSLYTFKNILQTSFAYLSVLRTLL